VFDNPLFLLIPEIRLVGIIFSYIPNSDTPLYDPGPGVGVLKTFSVFLIDLGKG